MAALVPEGKRSRVLSGIAGCGFSDPEDIAACFDSAEDLEARLGFNAGLCTGLYAASEGCTAGGSPQRPADRVP